MEPQEILEMIEAGKQSMPTAENVLMNGHNYELMKSRFEKNRFLGETLCGLEVKITPGLPDDRVYLE